MPTFERGAVVKVPFPYTDRATRQFRPALVVSSGEIEAAHGLLWVLMITSAENRAWPGDVPVSDLTTSGLPVPSVVRTAKVATIEVSNATAVGRISASSLERVMTNVARALGIARP
jgi:mRNA interferase MazF